ncbi:MAG: hypothetical protein JST59_02435 [Actinobacteria bacterium]|nr:hypothetical protein [Actinomycetota bacterium]
MQKLDIISNSTLITEDSKSARLAPRAPVPVQQHRKISFDDFQTSTDRLFGVFNVEEYKVIRGFIPGRGKRVRLHYTKF